RHARAFDGRTESIGRVGAPRRVGIHGRVGDEEAFTSADLRSLLIHYYLELPPAGIVIVRVEVVCGEVVGRGIGGGAFEAGNQIVGIVEGPSASHIRKFVEGLDRRLLEPGAVVYLIREGQCTTGIDSRGRSFDQSANVHRVNGDLGGSQRLHGALIKRGKISRARKLCWG